MEGPRQFDVCRLSDGSLVVVIQSDLVQVVMTRAVIPLMPRNVVNRTIRHLNPQIGFDGASYILMAHFVAALPVGALGTTVGSLEADRDTITRAVDTLLGGF